MEYILFCDESCQEGPIVSDFFGGCMVSSKDYLSITNQLNTEKHRLNLFREIKWTKVTANYLSKYVEMMDLFFSFIKDGSLKVRIMFRNNEDKSADLLALTADDRYYKLYFKFIRDAFGLASFRDDNKQLYLRIFLDKLPRKSNKNHSFRRLLRDMPKTAEFAHSSVVIRENDVAEVNSHEHVILQCLDVVLGAMYYKLNLLNLVVPEGETSRGKRTVAKEMLFEHIYHHIKDIIPDFDISKTTETCGETMQSNWEQPYRHWKFIPEQ